MYVCVCKNSLSIIKPLHVSLSDATPNLRAVSFSDIRAALKTTPFHRTRFLFTAYWNAEYSQCSNQTPFTLDQWFLQERTVPTRHTVMAFSAQT